MNSFFLRSSWSFFSFLILCFITPLVQAEPNLAEELDVDPALIKNSPVLQRWGEEIPNILEEIRHDPSFQTRLKLGYVQYPASDDLGGFQMGIDDILIGETGLALNLNYSESFNSDRAHWESDLSYSLFPLGNYLNLAPVIGYHVLTTEAYQEAGLNVGLQLRWVLSRTGAADLRFTQTFLSPGKEAEVGLTTLGVGYALTQQLRLGVEIQKQNARAAKTSRVGLLTEWQF